eukprot:CAMPEP_0113612712 /NCGR_PEP_ID=MMETSP0017_2-20120614/6250_1 /TAXON_ID=2856 /ORGANISM="Cylindrotheca closterium" /LENGTH=32 /DNA_ID=CAMNT_0000521773 /DNA_START=111 /DNA_END=205 /DNA_ORIENTATION=+ /assembly_acc=CAM_ASM_000147
MEMSSPKKNSAYLAGQASLFKWGMTLVTMALT